MSGAAATPLRRLWTSWVWPHRWSLAGGVLFLSLTNFLAVTIPVHIGRAIDLLTVGDRERLGVEAGLIAGMGLALIGVRTLSRTLFFNPGRDVEYGVRMDLFAHLLRLRPDFYAGRRTGDLVSRASTDITFVRILVGFGSLQLANAVLALTLTSWRMLTLSPRITLYAMLPVAVGAALVQLGIHQVFVLSKRVQEELGGMSDQVLSSFQGITTVQGFHAEAAFEARLAARQRRWLRLTMRLALVRATLFPLLPLGGGLAVALLLGVGGPMAVRGEVSVGVLAAFSALLVTLLPQLRSLGWLLSVVQRGQASLARVLELLDAPVARPEGPTPLPTAPGRGPRIELRGLRWSYPGATGAPALQDIHATLPGGAVIGVFGRTGSGKTTLLNLLARLQDPPEGTVFVDGVDICRFDQDAWRRRLAVAPQRPFLFSDSLRANVAMDDDPPAARVEAAVADAALEGDLRAFPDGLDTLVGQRGVLLSGGQRQRVALARALYRDADLVLLDDVLSAVDHETEARLVGALGALARRPGGPTVVLVSNRMSALRGADRVLVLDEGRLVDQGTHDELRARPGLYQQTWQVQRQAEEAS